MKRGRLPLTALRSFEAAGRLGSFSRAAEELFVSQAAISRQVRELEALLGRPLFERRHRRVELTEAGRRLLARLTASFDAVDRALEAARAAAPATVLRVSVEPSFAALWLVPRLDAFRRARPDVDVSVESDSRLVEFRANGVELAIRYALVDTAWPRVEARRLAGVVMAPVVSPERLAAGPPLAAPVDLARHVLLHEESRSGWARWFEAAGAAAAAPERGPLYADGGLTLQAAVRGHGVALADLRLAAEEIAAGRLVQPFPAAVECGAYWLVAPDLSALAEPAAAFAAWLEASLAEDGPQ